MEELRKRVEALELQVQELMRGSAKRNKKLHEPSPVSEVRTLFMSCYEKRYQRKYPMWGAKQSGMAKNVIASTGLGKILELIPFYLRWDDVFVVRRGHPFELLVTRIVELDALVHNPKRQVQAVASARSNTRQIESTALAEVEIEQHARRARVSDESNKGAAQLPLTEGK